MYEQFENYDEMVAGLVMLVWLVVGYRAGRLGRQPDTIRLDRAACRLVRWTTAGVVVLAGKLVTAGLLETHGLEFVANRLFALAFVVPPLVAAAVLTRPRLMQLTRLVPDAPRSRWWRRRRPAADPVPLTSDQRARASDPRLVVPLQIVAVGATIQFYLLVVERPIPPFTVETLVGGSLILLATAASILRFRRRAAHARTERGRATGPNVPLRVARNVGVVAVIAAVGVTIFTVAQNASVLPDRTDMTSMPGMSMDGSTSMSGMPMGDQAPARDVRTLTGDTSGRPDVSITLTARRQPIRLASGQVIDGLTFNGQSPGPQLRVRSGQLVEVRLVNALDDPSVDGVTLHWHGLDVPNAEDGVAGITQDAVRPGQSFVYRFRPHQVGTFWYHSHQASEPAVTRGLFGALVVDPPSGPTPAAASSPRPLDLAVVAHQWETPTGPRDSFGLADVLERRAVAPGTPVRLRVISTSSASATESDAGTFGLTGTSFRVAAIDGTDLAGPTDLPSGTQFDAGAGERHDLVFTMPDHAVRLTDLRNPDAGLALSPSGHDDGIAADPTGPMFDAATYGRSAPTPFGAESHFDRDYTQILDDRPGFYDGHFYFLPTINGAVVPDIPMLTVREGDLVHVRYVNRGHTDHPMHLHGHHFLVLSHDGTPTTGTPWWADTLDVPPGESYDIAFRADNPGVWMDHCHNLAHAATGMVQHLVYQGVTDPYATGRATPNQPE